MLNALTGGSSGLKGHLGWRVGLVLMALLTTSACQSIECYSNLDCGTGTCCQGTCSVATPIPLGPAACTEGCQCATWLDGEVERSQCLTFERDNTTQCTKGCVDDTDCLSDSGLQGRCLERDEVVTADRLCVWEAP